MTISKQDRTLLIKDFSKIFATKQDLKRFPTKDDLKRFATKDDLDDLELRFENKLTSFRSDLLEKLDAILKEILASREEETLLSHRVSDHEKRIEKLESRYVQP